MKTAIKSPIKKSYKKTASTSEPKQDKFISKILENLDKVNASEWEHYTSIKFQHPKNLFTAKQYQGFNILSLYLDTLCNGYTSSLYATFNSISKAGGKLRKGSKGALIEFFSFVYKDKNSNKKYTYEQYRELTAAQQQEILKLPCIRQYVVFNSNLIENIEELNLTVETHEPEELDFSDNSNCESFINSLQSNGSLKLEYVRRSTGAYSPSMDKILMPERKYFISEDKFYSTLFHECIHWTGHAKRLARNLENGFGDNEYSFEELIAEMGSMLLCLQNGIVTEIINSIRYLKGWSEYNKEDRAEEIKLAFIQSKRAKKYLESI